jgi:broad specificity phosphatase PhoE
MVPGGAPRSGLRGRSGSLDFPAKSTSNDKQNDDDWEPDDESNRTSRSMLVLGPGQKEHQGRCHTSEYDELTLKFLASVRITHHLAVSTHLHGWTHHIGAVVQTDGLVRRCIFGDRGDLSPCETREVVWGFEKVFIVRHGQSEWNLEGRRQGQLDSPLTETGRRSAQAAGSTLSKLDVDAIVSSPLGRAWQSAQTIDAVLGLGIQSESGLSEIDHGELAGLTDDEIEKSNPGLLAERRSHLYDWRFPGGESYSDGDCRAAAALRRIEATPARRPVLVTHEMIARMLLRNLLGLDTEDALGRSFAQGVVYQVILSSHTLTIA